MSILDGVKFTAVPPPQEPGDLPFVTHEGELHILGHCLRCYRISDGRAIIHQDDFHAFFGAIGAGAVDRGAESQAATHRRAAAARLAGQNQGVTMDKPSDDEVSNCPECDGQGSYDQWKAVAGHYEGGEVFRLQCDHCDGTGKVDKYGNPFSGNRVINCCFPDCGCDGARLCQAENGASGCARSLNIERGTKTF